MDEESVRNVNTEATASHERVVGLLLADWTLGHDELVASLIHQTCANMALVALFTQTPYEFSTMRTERGMS